MSYKQGLGILVLVAAFSILFASVYILGQISQRHIYEDQKVCIDGGGFFPQMMPGPSPFLVCGVIDGFDPDEPETVDPPASYPEGSHRLEGVDSQT